MLIDLDWGRSHNTHTSCSYPEMESLVSLTHEEKGKMLSSRSEIFISCCIEKKGKNLSKLLSSWMLASLKWSRHLTDLYLRTGIHTYIHTCYNHKITKKHICSSFRLTYLLFSVFCAYFIGVFIALVGHRNGHFSATFSVIVVILLLHFHIIAKYVH